MGINYKAKGVTNVQYSYSKHPGDDPVSVVRFDVCNMFTCFLHKLIRTQPEQIDCKQQLR